MPSTRENFAAFIQQCSGHVRVAQAHDEIGRIDAAAAAARDQQCNLRFDKLATDPATTSAELSILAVGCPAVAAGDRFTTLRSTLVFRERMDTETRRWGITQKDICSLRGTDLLARSNFAARRNEAKISANAGDSVASLLLGLDAFFAFAEGRGKLEESDAYVLASAKLGNPRAQVEHARSLFGQAQPDYAAIDGLLQRSRSTGCARASELMAYRVQAAARKPMPKPQWDASLTAAVLTREAVAGGVGQAACTLVSFSYDYKTGRWGMERAAREALYREAGAAGSKCGELALAQEGGRHYSGGTPFGPCAIDRYDCIRSRLRALRDQKVHRAGTALFAYLASKDWGGSGTVTPEAFAAIEQDAKAGESDAMVSVALYLQKGEGVAADTQLAISWCQRALALGDALGYACVGIIGQGGAQLLQAAYKRDPCAPYQMASAFIPSSEVRGPATQVQRAVKALPRASRARLKAILPNLRLALRESGKSSEACGVAARQWLPIVADYMEPYL